MPLRFDATLKDLARRDPAAFVAQFDAPPTEPVTLPAEVGNAPAIGRALIDVYRTATERRHPAER